MRVCRHFCRRISVVATKPNVAPLEPLVRIVLLSFNSSLTRPTVRAPAAAWSARVRRTPAPRLHALPRRPGSDWRHAHPWRQNTMALCDITNNLNPLLHDVRKQGNASFEVRAHCLGEPFAPTGHRAAARAHLPPPSRRTRAMGGRAAAARAALRLRMSGSHWPRARACAGACAACACVRPPCHRLAARVGLSLAACSCVCMCLRCVCLCCEQRTLNGISLKVRASLHAPTIAVAQPSHERTVAAAHPPHAPTLAAAPRRACRRLLSRRRIRPRRRHRRRPRPSFTRC